MTRFPLYKAAALAALLLPAASFANCGGASITASAQTVEVAAPFTNTLNAQNYVVTVLAGNEACSDTLRVFKPIASGHSATFNGVFEIAKDSSSNAVYVASDNSNSPVTIGEAFNLPANKSAMYNIYLRAAVSDTAQTIHAGTFDFSTQFSLVNNTLT